MFSKRTFVTPALILLLISCQMQNNAQSEETTVPAATEPLPRAAVESQPIAGGPVLLYSGIKLRNVAYADITSIKLALHPISGDIYILHPGTGLRKIQISQSDKVEKFANPADIVENANLAGMAFGPDGVLYVVANRVVDQINTQAIIRKGVEDSSGRFQWTTLAETEPYPLSNTFFDHLYNGIIVSADGQWVYVNAGSRTDHGEEENNGGQFPDTREVALTSKIMRIPADSENLVLVNDEAALKAQGLIFAWGTRNTYDMAFAPNGDLFGGDNGPDADYPDELNWLREGHHYGFPWKFGDQDNPQQFPDYTSIGDKHLSPDFAAVRSGSYRRDPDFPPAPGNFTLPVLNLGPAAAIYRAEDGSEQNAAEEGKPAYTFTPHRSPLGLVFATSALMPADYRSTDTTFSAFILSWGAAGGTFSDSGHDLLHMQLTREGDNYKAVTTQIARDFQNPIDSVLIDNKLYVLDFATGAIWELTFE
jgi:glucose/arabinose dehydrogenase